jgi:predicted small lipoprotein YifL
MDHQENHSRARRRIRYGWLLGAFLAALLPVACGKKGPLYLPDDAAAHNKPGAPATPPAPSRPDR